MRLRSVLSCLLPLVPVFAFGPLDRTAQPWPIYQSPAPADLVQGISQEPATGRPQVRDVGMVAPNVIALVVDARYPQGFPYEPYETQPGDRVRLTGYEIPLALAEASGVAPWVSDGQREQGRTRLFREVVRGDQVLGWLAGPEGRLLHRAQRMLGEPLAGERATDPASYRVVGGDGREMRPRAVHHKAHPDRRAITGTWRIEYSTRHYLYLELPEPLPPGGSYRVVFADSGEGMPEGEVAFRFDAQRLVSEAIHVNLVGYHPAQREKYARLSLWMGTGGGLRYPETLPFQIVDQDTAEVVFQGRTTQISTPEDAEYIRHARGQAIPSNTHKAWVHALDFSALERPGNYRVVVPGIGASLPFRIAGDVFAEATAYKMLGLLHLRSGIELKPPLTDANLPRAFHPDDGRIAHRVDEERFFAAEPGAGSNPFQALQAGIRLDTQVADGIWGGWHDANDFDRSLHPQQHNRAVHAMLLLYELHPEFYRAQAFRLPENEANNAIPDILDEALWCLDLFRRLQQEDGGVPSALESIEHPRAGEVSWTDSLPLTLMPPTGNSAYRYAAVAAMAARLLEPFDAELAGSYRDSALRAAAWGDRHGAERNFGTPWESSENALLGARLFAEVELYRLTGDDSWRRRFEAQARPGLADGSLAVANRYIVRATASYAMSERPIDGELRDTIVEAIANHARSLIGPGLETAFPTVRSRGFGYAGWTITPFCTAGTSSDSLYYAHILTGEDEFLDAMLRQMQFGMGLNPLNLSATSGLGARWWVPGGWKTLAHGAEAMVPFGFSARQVLTGDSSRWGTPFQRAVVPEIAAWPDTQLLFNVGPNSMIEQVVNAMSARLFYAGHLAGHFARVAE